MSYVYQVYQERKLQQPLGGPPQRAGLQQGAGQQQKDGLGKSRLEEDLVAPWDPPLPYHLTAFKDDRKSKSKRED